MRRADTRSRSERRHDTRLVIKLPAIVDDAVGETRDVSASGIYVSFPHASVELLPGSSICLEIVLQHATAEGPFSVTCKGEIVRVDRNENRVGVAARITSYQFNAAQHSEREVCVGHGRGEEDPKEQ